MADAVIRVKALEWKKTPGCHYWQASTPFNVYSITEYRGMVKPFKGEATNVALALDMLCTLEEAKAACQADFARRVGECVEVDEGWRDISTAPKDGTVVLVREKDGCVYSANFCPVEESWKLADQDGMRWNDDLELVAHWQPLPPPPGEEVEDWYSLGVKDGRDECIVERDALQARCDKLEAAARDLLDNAEPKWGDKVVVHRSVIEALSKVIINFSVVDGGADE